VLQRVEQGEPLRHIARDYGVSYETVRRVLRAARRRYVVRVSRISHVARIPRAASAGAGNRRNRSVVCSRSIFTRQVYHGRADPSREAAVPHDALNGTLDREKDAGRVCLLVQEWMLQVEEPA